jgi:peptidoglycan/LPS O-acetylase OafA/YrhL
MVIEAKQSPAADDLAQPFTPRYLSLDIWRGLACLMIVALHSSFYVRYRSLSVETLEENPLGSSLLFVVGRLGIGVNLFFVISGYCIAATADMTRRKNCGNAQYFKRRFRRIFPPYWIALLFTIAVVSASWACGMPGMLTDADDSIPHPSMLTLRQWLGNLTLTETWFPNVVGDVGQLELGPAWSLCYEEQFYAVCGLLLLISPRRFFTGALVATLLTVGVTALTFVCSTLSVQGFFFDGLWLLFATGVFVYYELNYALGVRRHAMFGLLALIFGCTVLLRYVFLRGSDWDVRNRAFEILVAVGFGLVLTLLHRWDKQIARCWLLRPLMFCGTICYSLYLIHWPITKLVSHVCFDLGVTSVWGTLAVTIPVATAASLGAAWVFHLLVERRFLNSAHTARPPHRAVAPIVASIERDVRPVLALRDPGGADRCVAKVT